MSCCFTRLTTLITSDDSMTKKKKKIEKLSKVYIKKKKTKIHCVTMSLETFALDPSSGQLRLISTFIVIRVLRGSARTVLLRMGCNVLQSFENRGRDRMRGWKVFTLRLEAIFVGDIRQRDRRSLCIWITERSLNDHYRIRIVHLFQLTMLLHLNAVSSFVGEDVRAIYVRSIGAVRYYRHWRVVNWRG